MAKIIDEGSAKPDDPIYSSGSVIGGKRFSKAQTARQQKPDQSLSPERAKMFRQVALMLDQALIMEGEALPEPGAFARRLSRLVAQGLGRAED